MRTLLIVDDHASVLETLAFVVTSRGYRALTAPSGQRAAEILEQEAIDAALVDLHMPGIDGMKTCRSLREVSSRRGHQLPVWLMSAALPSSAEAQAREAGAIGTFKKPFDVDVFLAAVEDACTAPASISPMPISTHAPAA
jgi:DNA-binding response OmpR family regulator